MQWRKAALLRGLTTGWKEGLCVPHRKEVIWQTDSWASGDTAEVRGALQFFIEAEEPTEVLRVKRGFSVPSEMHHENYLRQVQTPPQKSQMETSTNKRRAELPTFQPTETYFYELSPGKSLMYELEKTHFRKKTFLIKQPENIYIIHLTSKYCPQADKITLTEKKYWSPYIP